MRLPGAVLIGFHIAGAAILYAAQVGAAAQDRSAEDRPEQTISIQSDAVSDAAIEQRIRSIFAELSAFEKIEVTVDAGVVTLGGSVIYDRTKEQAAGLAARIEGVATVRNEIVQETSLDDRIGPTVERFADWLMQGIELLPLLSIALAVFLGFFAAGIGIARLQAPWNRIAPNPFIADLLRHAIRLVFVAVGLVVALEILGASALLGSVLGAAGIFGLAVGFAIRDTIENYVASILLSIRQPFRPNDHIMAEGHEGHVVRLNSRATVIMNLDGNHVRIPNATIFKGVLVNYSRNPERRFEFELGVNADADLAAAVELGVRSLESLEFVLKDPHPLGWIVAVGDSNVVLWFSAWIDQKRTNFGAARGEALRQVKLALEQAGMELPEPIYRLKIDNVAAATGAETAADQADSGAATTAARPSGHIRKSSDISEKVAAERGTAGGQDLLDAAAPTE